MMKENGNDGGVMIKIEEEDERLHPILYDPRFQWETSRPTTREILHDHIVCTATVPKAEQFGALQCCCPLKFSVV